MFDISPAAAGETASGFPASHLQAYQASYAHQLATNPVRTFLLGPQMPVHQPEQNLHVRSARRWHYLLWLGGFPALTLLCTLVPACIGLTRLGAVGFGVGVVVGLVFGLAPIAIYAFGLVVYAAGLFEWGILFNSRRGRKIRAGLGDGVLRRLYLGIGLAAFAIGILGGLGSTAFTAISFLLADVPDHRAANAAPRRIAAGPPAVVAQAVPPAVHVDDAIGKLESDLQNTRMQLDEQARSLGRLLAEVQGLQAGLAANPNQGDLRYLQSLTDRKIAAMGPQYESLLRQWEEQRNELQQLVARGDHTSRILANNASLPPDVKLDLAAIQAAIGRNQNSFHEPQLRDWEEQLTRFAERMNQQLTLEERRQARIGAQEGALNNLSGDMLRTKHIANFVAAVEQRHNYKSAALAKFRQVERRFEAFKADTKDELDRRRQRPE